MPATTRLLLSPTFVNIRNIDFFSIIYAFFNFACHNLSFLGGYIPIGQIRLFCRRLITSLSSLRTCCKNRCEPVAQIVANPVTPEFTDRDSATKHQTYNDFWQWLTANNPPSQPQPQKSSLIFSSRSKPMLYNENLEYIISRESPCLLGGQ